MTTVVIVIHLMVVLAMIGLVLLQRSEGGALGIGGGQGAFMSNRSAGNVLTRSTAVLAVAFFATSLGLALIAKYQAGPSDILERIPSQTAPVATETPAPTPPTPTGAPATAADLLQQLGGTNSAGGPQTPPASGGTAAPAEQAPAAETPAPAPAAQAPTLPVPAEAPVMEDGAPAADTTAPAQQTPPASGGTSQ